MIKKWSKFDRSLVEIHNKGKNLFEMKGSKVKEKENFQSC